MTQPRLAYLLKRFPRLSETFILNEILELGRQGLEPRVYALTDPLEKQAHPEATRLRPHVIYLHDPRRPLRSWLRLLGGALVQAMSRPDGALRVVWALCTVHRSLPSLRHAVEGLWLARDLRRNGITHLHAHFIHSPAAVAYLALLAGGPPFSMTAHAKDLYTTLPRNVRIRSLAARFVVTCTQFNAAYLVGILGEAHRVPIHVLYHGTDLQRFRPDRSAVEAGRILSVGRLVPKKGFPDLVRALAVLHARGVRIRTDIYGGGPLREELEAQGRRVGLDGELAFHGARLQDEIVVAYRRAAVFVLAPVVTDDGDRDGIPNVLVEAMASGVPVVATRISGIPELITHGVEGLLVPPHDPAALAAAIERVLRDPELADRLGQAGRREVAQHFDLARNTRRLRALFEGVAVDDTLLEVAV
jgi:glycosyltransferase involved in cell wall biosynthesis